MSATRTVNVVLAVGKLRHMWTFLPMGMAGDTNIKIDIGFWCRREGRFHQMTLRARSDQPLPGPGGFTHYRQMLYDQVGKLLTDITHIRNIFVMDIQHC